MNDRSPEAPTEASQPRPRRTLRWAALAASLPLVGLVGVLATGTPAGSRLADSPLLGKPAPDIRGETIDGDQVDLVDYRGRWVVVNFFATWCVPCRREHPEFVAFHRRHQGLGDAEVIGIVYSDSADAVRRYRSDHGGDWPMIVDPAGRIALDLGVAGVPESFLISPGGTVVAKVVGGVRASDLEELLARAKDPPP